MPRLSTPILGEVKAKLTAMSKALERPAYLLLEDAITMLWNNLSEAERQQAEALLE